jgi:peptide/nickel transport system permease protein
MEAIRLLKRRPWGIAGAVILLVVIVVAILAPVIAPYSYQQISLNRRLEPPGRDFILGTDNLGRDIFSRLLYGSRPYVATGLISVGIATVLGILLGFLSARIGGKTDSILRRAIHIPAFLFIAIILAFIFVRAFFFRAVLISGAPGDPGLFVALIGLLVSFILLPSVFTVVRQTWLATASSLTLALIPLILVNLGVAVGLAVLVIAPLSYYGFGVPPPFPEWGNMISGAGRSYLMAAPWIWQAPVIAIAVTVCGLILLGSALHEIWFQLVPGHLPAEGQL